MKVRLLIVASILCLAGCFPKLIINLTPLEIEGYNGPQMYSLLIEDVDLSRLASTQDEVFKAMSDVCKGDEVKIVLTLTPTNDHGGKNLVFVFGCKPKDKG